MRGVHKAGGAYVETLRPEDRAMVIDFDDKVFLIQDLTSEHDDLREAITTTQAIRDGSDYLVVGRPIREARDPRAAAEAIQREIAEALA